MTLFVTKTCGAPFKRRGNATHRFGDLATVNDNGACIHGPAPHNANLPGVDILRAMYLLWRFTDTSDNVTIVGPGLTTAVAARVLGRDVNIVLPYYAAFDTVKDDYSSIMDYCGTNTRTRFSRRANPPLPHTHTDDLLFNDFVADYPDDVAVLTIASVLAHKGVDAAFLHDVRFAQMGMDEREHMDREDILPAHPQALGEGHSGVTRRNPAVKPSPMEVEVVKDGHQRVYYTKHTDTAAGPFSIPYTHTLTTVPALGLGLYARQDLQEDEFVCPFKGCFLPAGYTWGDRWLPPQLDLKKLLYPPFIFDFKTLPTLDFVLANGPAMTINSPGHVDTAGEVHFSKEHNVAFVVGRLHADTVNDSQKRASFFEIEVRTTKPIVAVGVNPPMHHHYLITVWCLL